MKRLATFIATIVAGVTLAACFGGSSQPSATGAPGAGGARAQEPRTQATLDAGPLQTLQLLQQHFVNVVGLVRPSVVRIKTDEGLGSGVVYDAGGDIVTNSHVVGDASSFEVTWFDGSRTRASLVGRDPGNDLAMIKVAQIADGVRVATFTDSSRLQSGDVALAIGNPLGLDSTVTQGIVSAVGRTVPEDARVVLPNTIQTSAAINPGNSGGALVDISGQVIGIPTLVARDPQIGGAAQGIGFAISSNTVKQVADRLIANGPGA